MSDLGKIKMVFQLYDADVPGDFRLVKSYLRFLLWL